VSTSGMGMVLKRFYFGSTPHAAVTVEAGSAHAAASTAAASTAATSSGLFGWLWPTGESGAQVQREADG
jgi:hypothetical protein